MLPASSTTPIASPRSTRSYFGVASDCCSAIPDSAAFAVPGSMPAIAAASFSALSVGTRMSSGSSIGAPVGWPKFVIGARSSIRRGASL